MRSERVEFVNCYCSVFVVSMFITSLTLLTLMMNCIGNRHLCVVSLHTIWKMDQFKLSSTRFIVIEEDNWRLERNGKKGKGKKRKRKK